MSKTISSDQRRQQTLRAKMPFPPLPEEKERKIETFKCSDADDSTAYFSHWRLMKGCPRDMIAHAMGFAKAIEESRLTPASKALVHRKSLGGSALRAFDIYLAKCRATLATATTREDGQVTRHENLDQFDLVTCLRYFIAARTHDDSRHNQIEGLKAYRKPRSVDCHEWEDLYSLSHMAIQWLRGSDVAPVGTQCAKMYLESFPAKWISEFEKIKGTNLTTIEMGQITAFMDDRAIEANSADAFNKQKQKSEVKAHKKTRTAKHKSGGDKWKSKKEGGKDKCIQADDPCPIHGGTHKWGQCYSNANNPDNKGKFNKNKTKSAKDESHVMDTGSSDDDCHAQIDLVEPGFSDSEGKPAFPTVTFNLNNHMTHHLDSFSIEQVDQSNLIPSSATLRTRASDSHGRLVSKVIPSTPETASQLANVSNPTINDCLVQCAVENVINKVYDPRLDIVSSDNECYLANGPRVPIKQIDPYLSPSTVVLIAAINGVSSKTPLRCLFDPGSIKTYVYASALPHGCKRSPTKSARVQLLDTVTSTEHAVTFDDIVFPEFSPSKHITNKFTAYVVDSSGSFDIIFGRDFLIPVGIDVLCSQQKCRWVHTADEQAAASNRLEPWMYTDIPFSPVVKRTERFRQMQSKLLNSVSNELDDAQEDPLDSHYAGKILESKYDMVDTDVLANNLKHLSPAQREDLKTLFRKHAKLFNGKLGCYKHRKMHLELEPGAKQKLRFQRPYSVSHAHRAVFKQELDRLVELGVLTKIGASEHAAPTFIIPKKDGRVRWISDFRELNSVIKRRVYPLPRISDVLKKRSGYKYFTKLDISMQYYTFELTDEAKKLCVISTPEGIYRYNRAPMGVKQTPDFAQQVMEECLHDLKETDVYIDDVGCFSKSWQQHLDTLDKVLGRLDENNFTVNPLKCEWAVQETDWLGYWLTPTGLKPWKKKIDAILKLDKPRNIRDVRSFIGAVTFYRELFPRRSHTLTPLCELTVKGKKFEWLPRHQRAYDQAKAIIAQDAFIQCPDHNQPFHIYTDASDYQLGAVIMQNNTPVACYSRKLNSAQKNYTTMEKELLSVVYTLNEYRTMLYGSKAIHVYTDHKNLTYANLNSQRVLRWRLFLEDFAPTFHYIKGAANTLADALSRLPTKEGKSVSINHNDRDRSHVNGVSTAHPRETSYISSDLGTPIDHAFTIAEDPGMFQCFLNFPDVSQNEPFTLDYGRLETEQLMDQRIQEYPVRFPQHYVARQMSHNGHNLITHQRDINDADAPFQICIPDSMLDEMVRFYHTALVHPGSGRLYDTISQNFHHPSLKEAILRHVHLCEACQKCKTASRSYGDLPEREAEIAPWYEVAVDCIGPWQLRDQDGNDHEFSALTTVDTVTTYCGIILLRNKSAKHAAMHFENQWLARYPKPMKCIFDQGGEFIGNEFQSMLLRHGIADHGAGAKTPTANAVCERLHQTVGNSLRLLSYAHPPQNVGEVNDMIVTALQTASYASKAAMHSTMKLSPGAMVFGRDMLLNIPILADFQLLKQRRQALINRNLLRENQRRVSHDYRHGEPILMRVVDPRKLDVKWRGPYNIVQAHTNGTVTMQVSPLVTERVNMRRIKPFRQ